MNDRDNDNVIEIDLEELFGLLLHRWWLILLAGIVTALAGFAVSAFLIAPKYESTTGIYVMNKQDGATLTYSDTQLSSQLTKDYEELITSRYVLETVIATCGLEDEYEGLAGRVTVENASDTRIIYITVKDTDPAMAQYIANTIREVASEHIKSVTDVEAVNVVDQANLPKNPSEPSIPMWTVVGAVIGICLVAAIIIIRYLTDDTIKSSEDVEKYLGFSTLALIPVIEEDDVKKSSRREVVRKHTTDESRDDSNNVG